MTVQLNKSHCLKTGIVLTGYLRKLSPGFFGGWQLRYFELESGCIHYYANESKDVKKGTIYLEKIHRIGLGSGLNSVEEESDSEFFIDANDSHRDGARRVFRLKSNSMEESCLWLERINLELIKRGRKFKSRIPM